MKRLTLALSIYGTLAVLAVLINYTTDYGGLAGCVISLFGIFLSRTIVFLFLSFLNFSLSIAFDNFIRVDKYFYFYRGDYSEVYTLSVVSLIAYCVIGILDMLRSSGSGRFLINFEFPKISRLYYWPCVAIIVFSAIFIIRSESFVFSSDYNAYELRKYPFLEYISILIAFMLFSDSRKRFLSYIVAAFFIVTMIATSYRMVGIICTLSVMMVMFNKVNLRKSLLVAAWLGAYVFLTYISYWRLGHFDVSLENLFGYFNGRLDNTFTGVIETALAYVHISSDLPLGENIGYLIGTLLPVPNTFIPDSMLYILDAKEKYTFPGGGALAGFFMYFNYLLAIPYLWYFIVAFKGSLRPSFASGMYFILAITITRWWLYGPYVIFKFLGVMSILLFINMLLVFFESGISRISRVSEVRLQGS